MKIVVLDGYTLNPGDLSWDELRKMGQVEIYDRTPADMTVTRAREADIVFTNKTLLGREILEQLPALRFIGVLATGYNTVDTQAAKELGIAVANVPGYGTDSVAQHTFALLLALCHHVQQHSDTAKQGKWAQSIDFCYWDYPLVELSGKTMGIIGFGDIGKRVADIASAFGMRILAHSRTQTDQSNRKNFRWATPHQLLEESDVVSLHCPLFPETQGLIQKEGLQRMKTTAFLLNTSRGPLLVEEDVAEALNNGWIAGAAMDVLSTEPPRPDNPLLTAKNCLITPHIAWASRDARSRLMAIAIRNAQNFLDGKPTNIVNS